MNKNTLTFIECDKDYDKADIVIFGAPFDGTTSFKPGTRFGPMAIRNDSFGIETYSPYLDKDLMHVSACDIGDIEFPFGNTKKTLNIIEETALSILKDNKKPVMLGGEHLITLPMVSACLEKYPNLVILHLDAHTDLREDYLGEKLSHASVMKRIWEKVGNKRIYQFGIRSGEKKEFDFAKEHNYIEKFYAHTFKEIATKLKGENVYLSLDLDILDPSIFPGTGTPEAGGLTFRELLEDVIQNLQILNIVGADINELAPMYDTSGVSTACACKILREILLSI